MIDDLEWTAPEGWPRIETIDAHTGGEPLRIVVDGFPDPEGASILEKRRHAREELDEYRRALMYEPRGHADMYGAILTEPTDGSADVGVLFTHNDGYSTMCGHGIVALGTVLVEAGAVEPGPIRMETPAGIVTARPTVGDDGEDDGEDGGTGVDDGEDGGIGVDDGEDGGTGVDDGGATVGADGESDGSPTVDSVAFENVPSFVYARDRAVDVSGIGRVAYDVAFGGAFYAYCRAAEVGVGLSPGDAPTLADAGRRIKAAVADDLAIDHPNEPELSFLYGTIFTGEPVGDGADSRNVCVFADGEVDRCPTGTGVSGRLALAADDGRLAPGEPFTVESIVGSTFTGRYEGPIEYGGYDAVVPTVRGSAHVTGKHTFVLDPADPLREGFLLR